MQQICQWITPSYMKDVEYLPIEDTNFTSAHGMKRKQVKSIADCGEQPDTDTSFVNADERSKEVGSSFTEAELYITFIPEYECCRHQACCFVGGISSLRSICAKICWQRFPAPLQLLKDVKYVQMECHDLLKECESVSICVTEKMAESVEAAPRDQSHSK